MEVNKEYGRGNANMGGSMKNKITNPDLLDERAKKVFDAEELEQFFLGNEWLDNLQPFYSDIEANPSMKSTFTWYDMTREEKMEHWWKRYNFVAHLDRKKYYDEASPETYGAWAFMHLGMSPLGLHFSMFHKTIDMLASETKRKSGYPRPSL